MRRKYIKFKDYSIIENNDDIVGKKFLGKYGEFIVNGITDKLCGRAKLYECSFVISNYTFLANKNEIINCNIKDPYFPNILGIACIGNARRNNCLYSRWLSMIYRCYKYDCKDYKNYGGKGITVCDRWLCFENYIIDVVMIDGYDEKLILQGLLELDKDLKLGEQYNVANCIWITKNKNVELSNNKQFDKLKSFKAYNVYTKITIITKGANKFSKEHNLVYSCVIRCLNGDRKSHKGWIFEYIDKSAK